LVSFKKESKSSLSSVILPLRFSPLYDAMAKEGYHFFRSVPVKKFFGNFDKYVKIFSTKSHTATSSIERNWMSIPHSFLQRSLLEVSKSL